MTKESDSKLRCPSCGGPDVRRSYSRGMLDRIMTMFRKSPFRCRGCGRRFYRQDNSKAPGQGGSKKTGLTQATHAAPAHQPR